MLKEITASTTGVLQVQSDEDGSVASVVGPMTVAEAFEHIASNDLPRGDFGWMFVTDEYSFGWADDYGDEKYGSMVGYALGYDGPMFSSIDQPNREFEANLATEAWLEYDGVTLETRGPWSKD